MAGECPVCAANLNRRQRIAVRNPLTGQRLTVPVLLRNRTFGLFPGRWTVEDVLNAPQWVAILQEVDDGANAEDGVDFEDMPPAWRPRSVILGCCPARSKGSVHGALANQRLDSYFGCTVQVLSTNLEIACNEEERAIEEQSGPYRTGNELGPRPRSLDGTANEYDGSLDSAAYTAA